MMKRSWLKLALLLPLAAAFPLSMSRLQAQDKPPQHIDVRQFQKGVRDVVVPVPSEVFNALDKLGGNPNWASVLGKVSKAHPVARPEIAMLLGVVIADGFVAVEAKDSAKVNDIGRRVIELAGALSVKDAVLSHCNSIIDASKKDDWAAVRSELDKTQHEVSGAMDKLNDRELAELISIAGWLRGTDALSSLVSRDYQPDRADLLNQPDMLKTFEKQFDGMNAKYQGNAQVAAVRAGLKKIKPLIESHEGDAIPQKSVAQINEISTGLVKAVAP